MDLDSQMQALEDLDLDTRVRALEDMFDGASSNGLAIPQIARPYPPCGVDSFGKVLWDSTSNSSGNLMQCGASGIWTPASAAVFDTTYVVALAQELQRVEQQAFGGSGGSSEATTPSI